MVKGTQNLPGREIEKLTRDMINYFRNLSILVIIDSGPRYETPFTNGITHFIEKLAFNVSI